MRHPHTYHAPESLAVLSITALPSDAPTGVPIAGDAVLPVEMGPDNRPLRHGRNDPDFASATDARIGSADGGPSAERGPGNSLVTDGFGMRYRQPGWTRNRSGRDDGPGITIFSNGDLFALFRLHPHAILNTDARLPLHGALMKRTRSNTAEKGQAAPGRTSPPGEGWTAVGPGGDTHRPASAPPEETRRTEGTGPGLTSGTAEDLGTSGSRGSMGARDEYDSNALPGDGPGSRHSQLGRGQDTAR